MIRHNELLVEDLVEPGPGHDDAVELFYGAMPDEVDVVRSLRLVMEGLTPRRRNVLELILAGHHYNKIARALGVAEVTVSRDVDAIKGAVERLGREDPDEASLGE